jgi:hypothetical protein
LFFAILAASASLAPVTDLGTTVALSLIMILLVAVGIALAVEGWRRTNSAQA